MECSDSIAYATISWLDPPVDLVCRRRDKFEVIAWDQIQMAKHNLKDNVGLVTVLRTKHEAEDQGEAAEKAPAFAIANTHLLFNPRRGDIKV